MSPAPPTGSLRVSAKTLPLRAAGGTVPVRAVIGATPVDTKRARYELLVVAGLSGSGKSVFVSQLASRQLPAHILAELPPGAEDWQQFSRQELMDLLAGSDQITPGLIFQCTIGSPHHTRKFALRANDERSVHLFDWASSITIVHVKPTAERLLDQISQRKSAHQFRYASIYGPLTDAFAAAARGRLLTAKKRLVWHLAVYSGYSHLAPDNKQGKLRKLAALNKRMAWKTRKYQQSGFIERAHERWEDYVRRTSPSKCPIKEVFVRPAQGSIPGRDIRWEMAST